MATTDFYIRPEDGWVEVANAPGYIHIKPGNFHPWWVFVSASAPVVDEIIEATASGAIDITALPIDQDVIVVGSVTYTFVDAAPGAGDVLIGADEEGTRDNLLAALAGNAAVTAVADGSTGITLTATATGAGGNAVILTTDSAGISVSGSGTLEGGVTGVLPAEGLPYGRDPGDHRLSFELPVPTTSKVYVRIKEPISREPTTQKMHFAVLTETI